MDNKNLISSIRLSPQSTTPVPAEIGKMYFDNLLNRLRFYNGTIWVSI